MKSTGAWGCSLKPLQVDTWGLYEEAVSGGIPKGRVEAFWPHAQRAWWEVQVERNRGEFPFLDTPYLTETDHVIEKAKAYRDCFDPVIVLGIGGSSLGPQALVEAIFHPWMALEMKAGPKGPRVFFMDNLDPSTSKEVLEIALEGNPLVIVISKSGETIETLAQLLAFLGGLKSRFSDWKDRLLVITDPQRGPLREFVKQEALQAFDLYPKVVGRFSVLSVVGIVPAEILGIDTMEFLLGAIDMDRSLREGGGNPALETAAILFLLHREKGKSTWVTMIYGDALWRVGPWRVQLLAESLGKREDFAPTPFWAKGPMDQHSQLQLWLDGPKDKAFTVLRPLSHVFDLELPKGVMGSEEAKVLEGKRIQEILEAERKATEYVLAERGCPFYQMILPLTPRALGGLFFFWEVETLILSKFYQVNPLNQPAVEKGKRLTWALLGRKGFEKEKEEIDAWGR